ncbi:M23 family metallopeptidase [candidate division WOR-3 bacterium]|nr:M23 family metallopeptidase [candidate division WOR-3 bacterium]
MLRLLGLLLVGVLGANASEPVTTSDAVAAAAQHAAVFAFPLDPSPADTEPYCADFENCNVRAGRHRKYHAARDYARPAGTPVYAIADGRVSFSGRMGGYGWLVIVDHPQANLYSLYGHLSPSRWHKRPGPVRKGELIAYLGDSTENGGTPKHPLVTHLHFGVRAGQRADYPSQGEWRWQAGWIRSMPSDLGWLHPAAILAAESLPAGGFRKPRMNFMSVWYPELLRVGFLLLAGLGSAAYAYRKKKPALLLVYGIVLSVIARVFWIKGMTTYLLPLAAGILLLVFGGGWLLRDRLRKGRQDAAGP